MARPIKERGRWFLSNLPSDIGRCLEHTHDAIDLPAAGINSANDAVSYLRSHGRLYGGQPPKGAMVLWTSSTDGHAALSLGRSIFTRRYIIASTDVRGPRTVGRVPLGYIAQNWGHQYAGWSNWYGGEEYEVGVDMPLSNGDIDKIAKAVWEHQLENTSDVKKQKYKASWFLNNILDKLKK